MRDLKRAGGEAGPGRWMRLRVRLVALVFGALLIAAFGRAVNLQIFERDKLRELAQDQYVRQIDIPARRGDIFDRRGTPLAQSVEVDSIWVDPSMLPDVRRAAKELAKRLHVDGEELSARLTKAKRFAWVKRQARPDEVEAVRALAWQGMGFTKEPRRFYPQRELAAHVVGLVGSEGKGLEGLELAFDDELTGENSQLLGLRDAKGRKLILGGGVSAMDRQGAALTLTLDRSIQYLAEKALTRAVEESKGIAGMAVVLDPKTGELLGLANYPRFNPNAPDGSQKGALRNRAALDAFEPGSTFKSFVVAAALEEKAVKPEDIFFCENGAWDVGRHTVNDTHPHGWLTPQKILQVSSNIGAAKVAQVLGRERLVDYYARFGFGEKAGLSLPGEARGVVPFPKAEISLATEAYGQGLTASAIQLASAYGALANDGVLMRPYLVSRVVDPDGVVLLENRPTPLRQVVSAKTARQVVGMLESVVDKEGGGTAGAAKMSEYRVAGKTGTAQKADPVVRGYSDKRIASFVGIVPADRPRLVILVVVDEPKTSIYGGDVAAPAFKEIAQGAMPYLGISPDSGAAVVVSSPGPTPAVPVRGGVAGVGQGERSPVGVGAGKGPGASTPTGPAGPAARERAIASVVTEHLGEGSVEVPDLTGQVGREAVSKLLAAALEPRLSGSGRVVSQSPAAGSRVERGSRVTLEMATRQ